VSRASVPTVAAGVLADLERAADPERRAHAVGYFPTSLEILGVSAPDMRRVLRPLARSLAAEVPDAVLAVARALLGTRIHEARQVAFELVGGRRDVVAELDRRAVEALGDGNDNWASVDCFSVVVAGPAWRDGRVADRDVLRWTKSDDRWWRRTALVSTVALNMKSRGGSGDPGRTLAVCEALAADDEVMVAKGLSWALRALISVDRAAVVAFLAAHDDGVPALVRREVVAKLETGLKNPRRTR
jgi:3-methyladenine DNA glycosylase AlkD